MITMHPGEYLLEVYLEPLAMMQSGLAKRLQVDKSSVSRVISGKAELPATMAWMGMQTAHSLMLARKNLAKMDVDGTELAPA